MLMYEAYIKSLQMIKQYNITSRKEYTKLVEQHNLLNIVTLEYISGRNFSNIVKTLSEKIA